MSQDALPKPANRPSRRQDLIAAAVELFSLQPSDLVTVADIVRRARVSRVAFYAHFRGKDDCFLAAVSAGGQLLRGRVIAAARGVPRETPPEEMLRAGCRAFLSFLAEEPAFARVFYVDMPAAGPSARERLDVAVEWFAEINRRWHLRARMRHPEWPAVPDEAYLALAGATGELVRATVRADRTKELPDLEDTLVSLHLAVMAGRPWGHLRPGPSGPPPRWRVIPRRRSRSAGRW